MKTNTYKIKGCVYAETRGGSHKDEFDKGLRLFIFFSIGAKFGMCTVIGLKLRVLN